MALGIFTAPYSYGYSYRNDIMGINADLEKSVCTDGLVGRYSSTTDIALFLKNEIKSINYQSQREANNYLPARYKFMEQQTEEMININLRFSKLLSEARSVCSIGSGANAINLRQNCDNMLDDLTSILNRKLGVNGEVTMAGVNSQDNAVVNLKELPSLPSSANADFSYYIGRNIDNPVTPNVADTVDVLPVTARDESIEMLIRALLIARNGNPNDFNDPSILKAINLCQSVSEKMPILVSKVAINHRKVDRIDESLAQSIEDLLDNMKVAILQDGKEAFIKSISNKESLQISRQLSIQNLTEFNNLLQQLERSL